MEEKVPQNIVTPQWLTQSFIIDLLKKATQSEDLTVHETKLEPATSIGENYVSQMIRLSAIIQKDKSAAKEALKLILKTVMFEAIGEELKKTDVYIKEARMFTDVLPAMDSIIKNGCPSFPLLHAICYDYRTDLDELIVLEDLRVSGFQLADRFKGLDMDHIILVLKSLGKFHAASYALVQKRPEIKQHFNEPAFSMKNSFLFEGRFQKIVKNYQNMVGKWKEGPVKDKCTRILNFLEKNFMVKTLTNFERDDAGMNMLVHGDCWTNNIMFKLENSKPTELRFVDFQISSYNSPAIDLAYFLFTSSRDEVRFGDKENLLRTYYDAFSDAVEKFKIVLDKPFTFEHLKQEFNQRMWVGMMSSFYIFPYTMCPSAEAPKAGEVFGEDSHEHVFNNELMAKMLPRGFDYFDKHGIFG